MMPGSTEDLPNWDTAARIGGTRRRVGLGVGSGAAAALLIAVLVWNTRGSSTHTVSLVAATPTTAPVPSFCPAARTYVDKLPLIQVSLSDTSKLPGLLFSVAPGVGASISTAPADVQADAATLTKAIGTLQADMATANNQLSKLAPQRALILQSPTVSQAIEHLVRYVNTTCG